MSVYLTVLTLTADRGGVLSTWVWQIAARATWLSWCLVGRVEVSRLVSQCSNRGCRGLSWRMPARFDGSSARDGASPLIYLSKEFSHECAQ